MPAATKKELKIATSIAELNVLANDIPKLTDARKFLKTAEQVFKKADELNLQGDEESSYIMYMRYFNIITAIKKSADYRKNEKFFKEMIGSKRSIRAITEAERLSGSLKNRYEEKEAEQVSEKLEALHIKREKEKEVEKAKDEKAKQTAKDDKGKKSGETTENSEKDAEAAEENGQPKSKPWMSVHELYGILKQSAGSILIMDVRSTEHFTASRINHKNIINVPFEILPPGSTVNYIEKALPEESRGLWMRRADMEHIVILDWRCGEGALTPGTTLASLKDALWKWDMYTRLKSEPVVLTGGYDEWLNYYPTLSTNANVPRPPTNVTPVSNFSLDSIQYEFDEGFLNSPEKDEQPPSKLDLLRQELADLKEANATMDANANNKPTIPSVDRSLKPSADLNNSIGRLSESGSSSNTTINRSGLEMIKNELKKDLTEDDSYTKNSLRSGDSVQDKNSDLSKAPIPTSTTPTLVPKVNNVPSVNRTLKPKLGSAEGSALASAEHEAAQKARLESQQRYDMYKAETHGLVEDRKAKIAQLMEEEKRVEELKRKELTETADIMRIKRRIQKEVDDLKAEQEKNEAEGRARKEELQRLLEEEAQKLQLRREAERLRALKKRDNNTGSGHGSREDSPVHQAKGPVAPSIEDDISTKQNEAKEKQEVAEQERERREMERREFEQRKQQLIEKERKLAEQQAHERQERERQERERQERERLAREHKQEQERQAEMKRLERDRTDKEWIERENKKAAARDGGTPVSRRDPITGSYTPGNAPSTPGADSRPTAATPTPRQGTPNSRAGTPTTRTPAKGIVPGLGPVTPENRTSYKARLRDEDDTPRSGGMRRSHSSPNIAQLVQDENIREPLQPHFPNVDRGSKPRSPRPELQMVPAKTEVSAAKVRNLQPTWGNVGRGLTGLRNLGNTCYMNSTIQCLSNTSFLTTYFLTDNHRNDINRENVMGKKGEVAEEFAVLIKALWTGQYRSINPRDFKSLIGKHHPVFAGFDQQDSQEMLLFLMDSLHEDLNKIRKRPKQTQIENDGVPDRIAAERSWLSHKRLNDSIIVDLFQGQFMSTLSCMKCDKTSVTFDSFMYLTVPIPSNSRCTLRDCLLHFAKEEKMTGDSQWHCPRCKCPRDARKRIVIYRLPRILLIHLKRFYYQGMWRQKINAQVDFPLDGLDLNHYVEGPEKQNPYNLYAVSNHYGTMEGGHYTAFCKSPSNGRWYKYDDHEVYDISRSDIKSPAAYILYYTSIQQDLRFAS